MVNQHVTMPATVRINQGNRHRSVGLFKIHPRRNCIREKMRKTCRPPAVILSHSSRRRFNNAVKTGRIY